jgi:hypothetical protein
MIRASLLVPVALIALTLSGCGGTGGGGGTTGSPSASTPETPSASPSETGADGGGPGIPAACTRGDLTITYAATDNSAGHSHGILTFANSAGEPCGMAGFPIVYMGSSEVAAPVGLPASPDGPAGAGFVIAPGQAATSAVTITQAGIIEGCNVVQTTHLVVAPPQDDPFVWEDDGRNVPIASTPSCNEASIGLITVGALQPTP